MSVVNLTMKNFEAEVLQCDKPVLVDFWASWCGPCKMMGPVIEELSEEYSEYKFCKINVDQEEGLAIKYKIMSIPAFKIFKNGEVVKESIGAQPKDAILELFN